MNGLNWFKEIGIVGGLDIACLGLILYFLLVWFKKTRAAFVLTGILIVSAFYLFARQFNMVITASLLENFFAVIFVALVVIFQEELRRFFERVAVWSLTRQFRKKILYLSREEVQILVRTVIDLAKEKVGALIVIRGKDMIARLLEGGVDLNGELSEGVLKSLFDPHSMGHDGAVIIEGNRISKYSAYLPLSKNLKAVGIRGTRHAAALGLCERTDALCLVVSEERGSISLAHEGEMETVNDPEKLTVIIEKHYQETYPRKTPTPWELIRRNGREKIIAVLLSFAVWFVFYHGSKIIYKSYRVPISMSDLPRPLVISHYEPREVDVTLYGPRKAFYFLNKDRFRPAVSVKKTPGVQTINLSSKHFSVPLDIVLDTIDPTEIRIEVALMPGPVNKSR